ncbi:MAG TPA: glycosyltransferase, partial [Puia sp.]|nr:glycosyltransferase [Puia sp.]
ALQREKFSHEITSTGIKIEKFPSFSLGNLRPFGIRQVGSFIQLLQQKYADKIRHLPGFLSGSVHKEIERIARGVDLIFFPWPYLINCPDIKCPIVSTFHDFNFKYYFTGHSYSPLSLELLNREIPLLLEKSFPVVSTYFMKKELGKFYPQFEEKTQVIHLAPLSALSDLSEKSALKIVRDLGVDQDYILYPGHIVSHKNLGALLVAHFLLKKKGHKVLLILTGELTETVQGRSFELGVERGVVNKDVIGLGYVSNLQMDALIQCAKVVVSTSLYEAGNGPGLDAWKKGTPVAMSNIPSFVEHLDVQNVRAAVFDPLSPPDIADKLDFILRNPVKAAQDAQHSKEAIQKFTWELTAEKYFEVFDKALASKGSLR